RTPTGSSRAMAGSPISGNAVPAAIASRQSRSTTSRRTSTRSPPEALALRCQAVRLPNRKLHAHDKAVRLAVVQRQLAAMGDRDRACDGEAEPEAGGVIHVARVVAAHERLQHLLLALVGNAGTVVLDVDGQLGAGDVEADRDLGAEAHR